MAAPRTTPLFVAFASTLALGSSAFFFDMSAVAQASLRRQPPLAQFTPPKDSQLDGDAIITSTGTYFRAPRDSRPRSGPRTSTGTRGGCLGNTDPAFAVLAPSGVDNVLGQTVSNRPTFTWYLPEIEADFPVKFRLLAPDTDGVPISIYETTLDYTPGFVTHWLPVPVPALSQGIEYRWQVIIECNPARPSQALIQERLFEVVPQTPELAQVLAAATTDAERAIAYGQAGAWYEAILPVVHATSAEDRNVRTGLLTDLAASLPATTETEQAFKQNVLDIAEATR